MMLKYMDAYSSVLGGTKTRLSISSTVIPNYILLFEGNYRKKTATNTRNKIQNRKMERSSCDDR